MRGLASVSRFRLAAMVLAVNLLAEHCAPALAAEPAGQQDRIHRLITQLGNADYQVREQAQADLAKLGFDAFDALSEATTDHDPEIAARARYLLRLMRVQWTLPSDPPEVKQWLQDYELLDMAEQFERMRRLAALPGGAGLPALCRLVRFEQSAIASKYAAAAILGLDFGGLAQGRPGVGRRNRPASRPSVGAAKDTADAQLAGIVEKQLGASERPGANWLRAYAGFSKAPDATLIAWKKFVDAEMTALRDSPAQVPRDIVATLVRRQVGWLMQLDRKKDATAATRTLLDLERGDAPGLMRLVDWLVQQQAWEVLGEVTTRFPTQFARSPELLYALAQGYLNLGKTELAEQTAARAFALNSGNQVQHLARHLQVAGQISRRGCFAWAAKEYRYVIERGPAGHPFTLTAQDDFARQLHDQGQDHEAAQVLEKLVKAVETLPAGLVSEPRNLRARMHYYFAEGYASKGDRAKQREHLEKALQDNSSDVDALIAAYHVPGATAEFHKRVVRLVHDEIVRSQDEITKNPDNPDPYNQYAWLVANTEGDRNEAIRCSQKSLELAGEEAGYYDTLGRCYYAKGDLENAVKYQTIATELDPHCGLIARQMELFRKALDQKRSTEKGTSPTDENRQ